ncbi:MAG: PilZ domain-containing protein, partial [Desulfobacterales bacterium]
TEMPVKTVSLEETETSMRANPRKTCLINANYRIQNRDYKSYILDISIGGVFVETSEKFAAGQKMLLNFSLPKYPHPFGLTGKIAWVGSRGFGVKFDEVTQHQKEILKTFVEPKNQE